MTDRLQAAKVRVRSGLIEHGTDVEANERDPEGDGDQSPISRKAHHQFYRDLFSQGGDLNEYVETFSLSDFAMGCISGNVDYVKPMLEYAAAREDSTGLTSLLETRETSMRQTPLMLIVSVGKGVSRLALTPSAHAWDRHVTQRQIHIAELLLQYGARPDARDVCGKTVCHYGAGMMASETTMAVVERAAKAYESSHLFQQEVELVNLTTENLNGQRGVALGYIWAKGRRQVRIHGRTVAVKPENVKLLHGPDDRKGRNLCDLPCRLGMTSLLEVIPANRADVADFLLKKLNASIDIPDADNVTARSMALKSGAEVVSKPAGIVKDVARKSGNAALKTGRRKCSNCGTPEPTVGDFSRCSSCMQVRYCGKECQVAHWHAQHKGECKEMKKAALDGIRLETPRGSPPRADTLNFRTGRTAPSGSFKKPSSVAVDEKFYVKCQSRGRTEALLIYDETRECSFYYGPGLAGFDEVQATVEAEPAFQGKKTYMKASFGADGVCTIFLGKTALQKW